MDQASKHIKLKYQAKYTTKFNKKIPLILQEKDIHCFDYNCQVCWTTAESDCLFQNISKIVYLFTSKDREFGASIQLGASALAPFALWKTCP